MPLSITPGRVSSNHRAISSHTSHALPRLARIRKMPSTSATPNCQRTSSSPGADFRQPPWTTHLAKRPGTSSPTQARPRTLLQTSLGNLSCQPLLPTPLQRRRYDNGFASRRRANLTAANLGLSTGRARIFVFASLFASRSFEFPPVLLRASTLKPVL